MEGIQIDEVRIERILRETLLGNVHYGTASITLPSRAEPLVNYPIIIKEYELKLVEERRTRSGQPVAERAEEELRIHTLLSRRPRPPNVTPRDTTSTTSPNDPHHPQQQQQQSPQQPSDITSFLTTGHPHLVHMFDVRRDHQCYYALLEYCSGGEFFPLVQEDAFTPQHARFYFHQLMLGVHYLHQNNIAHRDLSLENLLLDDGNDLKICDFGVALDCNGGANGGTTTGVHGGGVGGPNGGGVYGWIQDTGVPVGKLQFYMPPEVLSRQPYSPGLVDVWTAGIILFVMLTKNHPFKYATREDPRFNVVMERGCNELLRMWRRPLFCPATDDLLRHMLCPLEYRYSAEQILRHPFLLEPVPMFITPAAAATATAQQQQQQQHVQPLG